MDLNRQSNKDRYLLLTGIFLFCTVLNKFYFEMGFSESLHLNSRTVKESSQLKRKAYVHCNMETCFDYSRCPIANKFLVYIYPSIYRFEDALKIPMKNFTSLAYLHRTISQNHQITQNPKEACVFIVLLNSCNSYSTHSTASKPDGPAKGKSRTAIKHFVSKNLKWSSNGQNHLIWSACESSLSNWLGKNNPNAVHFEAHGFGRAMVVSQKFSKPNFRSHFDFVVSHLRIDVSDGKSNSNKTQSDFLLHLPPLFPTKRKYLAIYFQNEHALPSKQTKLLHRISRDKPTLFQFVTQPKLISKENRGFDSKNVTVAVSRSLQAKIGKRDLLLQSTFSLIMHHLGFAEMGINASTAQWSEKFLTTSELQRELYNVLKSGAIPVVIGTQFHFPFSEFIDWSKIALTLPWGRLKELSQILEDIPESDIIKFRKNGRRVFVKYLNSIENVVETLLAGVRTRVGIPPAPYGAVVSQSAYPFIGSNPVDNKFNFSSEMAKVQNVLGKSSSTPKSFKIRFASPKFKRNVSSSLFLDKYKLWNVHYQPFRLLPSTPWDISVPSEALASVSTLVHAKSVRPTYGGDGGNSKLFRASLGGNVPAEQFTIVVLTFERELVLMNLLQTLVGLPHLNGVVVVWNTPKYPLQSLTWPEIGVPIHVITSKKNSVNNRFIPYDEIQTDAILSIDDDIRMSHEEILLTFRVWRENRDRLVGLPGRYHVWEASRSRWMYVPHSLCELSIVLTGAAFYHKYYGYMYTFEMPAIIREEVDRFMNCEDIAMNFLVSHLTQKPPIKVTGRKFFNFYNWKKSLTGSKSHYYERNACLNIFSKMYGHMPLLNTQFRANSIQFGFNSTSPCFKGV